MPDASYAQSSFHGGEWSKSYQGRFDLPAYRTAMNVCLNALPIEQGAWVRRPGLMYASHTRGGAAGRLITFTFKQNAPYNMEFTDGVLRFHSGLSLVTTNDDQTVLSISTANPAVVQTAAAHGWASGNTTKFPTINMPLLQNRQFTITVVDATHFSIADAITGDAIDGSTLGAFTSGTVSRVLEITTSYGSGIWSALRSVQADKQAALLHGSVAPQMLSVSADPTLTTFAEFSLDPVNFLDGPYLDPVKHGAEVTASALNGVVTLTLSFAAWDSTKAYSKGDFVTFSSVNYQSLTDANQNNQPDTHPANWTAVSAGLAIGPNGFQGSDVGRLIRLFSEPDLWNSATAYSTGNKVSYNNAYWVAKAASTNVPPDTDATKWGVITGENNARWTWGRITGLSNIIDRALAGSVDIGDMVNDGDLAASFDGVTSQDHTHSSASLTSYSGAVVTTFSFSGYIGKNYSGASAQQIGSATLYPSSDNGLFDITAFNLAAQGFPLGTNFTTTVNLRAKQTAPANAADGTLLGSFSPGANVTQLVSFAITSNDPVTAWNYVWFEVVVDITSFVLQGGARTGADSITAHTYSAEAQFFSPSGTGTSGNGCTAQILGDALLYTVPVRTWRLGLYSDTLGWPKCGTYHEGRLWLSGAVDNRLDASVAGGIDGVNINMAPTNPDGTVTDASGISYTFDAPDVNPILWMEPDQQGIICGTQVREWLVQPSSSTSGLTVLNIQAHPHTHNGCANILPRRTEHTLVFVQRFGRKLKEMFADVFSGKFSAPNLSLSANHLMTSGIEEIAYQQELAPVIWARMGDGSIKGCTYKRDTLMTSQGPTFVGWHRHTLGSGRLVESICVGPNENGDLDSLAMVTNDPATGIRHVEVMADLFDENASIKDAWFLDDSVAPSSYVVDIEAATLTLNGLWHLNGKTVSVFVDGLDAGDFPVANGSCTVPIDGTANTLLTASRVAPFAASGLQVAVGFTYDSDGQLLRLAQQQDSGAANGPAFGKVSRSHQVAALLQATQGISFGTTFANLRPALFRSDGQKPYAADQLFSDVYWNALPGGYSLSERLCWRISRPFPAIVAAVSTFQHTMDR